MENNKTNKRPNMILILADDMGYSDIGCFGSEISTPNIDSLSAGGVNFTQAYNCARCCPSRASLLTGLYPHQAGIGHMTTDFDHNGYKGTLNNSCLTITEVLKGSGYSTAMSGKWHVTSKDKFKISNGSIEYYPDSSTPRQRGFDHFYGNLLSAKNYFNPTDLILDDSILSPDNDDYYYTDAIADYAVDTIDGFKKDSDPFFLYVAYTAPHWPLHAPREDIAKYQGSYLKGWDHIRTARYETQKSLDIIDPCWDISARDELSPLWEDIKYKEWEDRKMAVYAAQVEKMDKGIGRIINKLKETGTYDNTIIIFLSDNGGCAEFLPGTPQIQNMFKYSTREGKEVRYGNNPSVMPGTEDTFQSYDLPWANVSNTPFRLFKHWAHEGGISTPLIMSWPGKIKGKTLVHSPVHLIDLMATFIDAAGASYPKEFKGNPITSLEGESLIPALSNSNWQRQKPLCWEHEGNSAVRDGRLKLVSRYPGKWELYDMETDRTEQNDLSGKYINDVNRLNSYYNSWAQRCGVLPWPVKEGIDYSLMDYDKKYWKLK